MYTTPMMNAGMAMTKVKRRRLRMIVCSWSCMLRVRCSRVGGRYREAANAGSTETIREMMVRMVKSGGAGSYDIPMRGSV